MHIPIKVKIISNESLIKFNIAEVDLQQNLYEKYVQSRDSKHEFDSFKLW